VPANSIAQELGSERVSNMVMLGALLKALPLLPEGAIERALAAHTAERHKSLMTVNVEALKKGMTYA